VFHHPGRALPRGSHFLTVEERDRSNDRAARRREGVSQVDVGMGEAYERWAGPWPARPPKRGVVASSHDFTQLGRLAPHPVHGRMGRVSVLDPSVRTLEQIAPLTESVHRRAAAAFGKRIK
jgi:hypothetical protein